VIHIVNWDALVTGALIIIAVPFGVWEELRTGVIHEISWAARKRYDRRRNPLRYWVKIALSFVGFVMGVWLIAAGVRIGAQ
jgi:hypothetical protein